MRLMTLTMGLVREIKNSVLGMLSLNRLLDNEAESVNR